MADEQNVVLDLIGQETMKARGLSRDVLQANQDLIRKSEQTAANLDKIYTDVADASYLKTLTEQVGALNAQRAAQTRARSLGIDPGSAVDELANTYGQVNVATNKTYGLMQEWQKNQTVSFLSDPVEWVKARWNEDTLKTDLTQTAAQADFLTKKAQNLNNLTQQGAITEKAIATTMTAASAEATATILSAEARVLAQKAELEQFSANYRGVKAAMDAKSEQLGFAYNYNNAIRQEENTSIALEQLALSKGRMVMEGENQKWQRDFKQEQADAKNEGKQIDAFYAERINLGRQVLGMEPYPDGPSMKGQITLFKTGGSQELAKYYHLGDMSMSAGKAMIGAKPSDAIRVLDGGHNLPAGREGAMSLLYKAREAALANPTLDAKKDPQKYDEFINKWVKDEVTRTATAITKDSHRFIGDLKSYLGDPNAEGGVIGGISSLVSLPITQKVFAPLIKNGQPLDDPTMIRAIGAKAVLDGVITSSEYSSGLSQIFQKANEVSIASNDYVGMGIQLPKAGKSYFVPGGMFAKPVDMTNATQLGQMLAQDLARIVGAPGSQVQKAREKFGAPARPYVPSGN